VPGIGTYRKDWANRGAPLIGVRHEAIDDETAVIVASHSCQSGLIVGVYESKEVSDRFIEETLMPLMPIDGGLVGPPQAHGAEAIDLQGLTG
jgi:hypothetical protein